MMYNLSVSENPQLPPMTCLLLWWLP